MFSGDIKPGVVLAEHVRAYRILDLFFTDQQSIPFKAYPPRPQDSIYFYPKDTETVQYHESGTIYTGIKTLIIGQQTVSCNRYVAKNFLTFQVIFQPGMLHRITGIPAGELNNCYLDAELILGKNVSLINEQLFFAKDYSEMVRIVELYLSTLMRRFKKSDHTVDRIGKLMIENVQQYSLDWFCKQACLSPRQFERKFKEYIGVNPKLYARIIRFDNVFRMKNKYPHKDWLSIAVHCGYHDYQHLVREYKDFTGCTPNEFFALESNAPERFFGDAET